jgi:hypothetical protein
MGKWEDGKMRIRSNGFAIRWEKITSGLQIRCSESAGAKK